MGKNKDLRRMTDHKVKRRLFLFSAALLILLAFAACRKKPQVTRVGAEILGQEELEEIKRDRKEYMEETALGELYYQGVRLPYSEYNQTLYLTVMEGQRLKPEEFLVEGSSDMPDFSAAFEEFPEDEELMEAVREGKEYRLLFYTGEYYKECRLVFTGMPVMDITFSDETDGDYTIVHISMQSGALDGGRVEESDARMRIRGGVSRNYPKLGFKLKLFEQDGEKNRIKREVSLLGMRRSDTWNLSALYADDTKIRDKAAIDLWAQMSSETIPFSEAFGTRMEYVEVVMNGQYMGIYGLLEPIDEQQLGITEGGEDGMYEYYYKKEGEAVVPEEAFLFDSVDEKVPLKEEDAPDMQIAGLELKNGNGHSARVAWEPVRRYMAMVREQDFSSESLKLLDPDNVADVWIYIQAIAGVDNRVKNLYYCAKVVDGDYRLYFIPWDMDMTWGNETDETSPTLQSYYTYPADHIMNWSPATQMIAEDAGGIRSVIRERWKELRKDVLSDKAVTSAMEEQDRYIRSSGAFDRDRERWEDSPHAKSTAQITDYAVQRLHALDSYILDQDFPDL